LENSLGTVKSTLTKDERIERNNIMRRLFLLKPQDSVEVDTEDINSLVMDFFISLNLDKIFNEVQICPLPKDMFINLDHLPILKLEEAMFKSRSLLLVKIIIIHELYHKFVQNMNPDMKQVKYLRDVFGQNTITEMDIDSDVATFNFLESKNQLDFNSYLNIIHSGLTKNYDSMPRVPKITRSIGSILSIYVSQKTSVKHVLVPDLNEITGGKNFLTCISTGRKFATIPSVSSLVQLHYKPYSDSLEEFISLVTERCEECYESLIPQLNLNHQIYA
jgi:hypothetical protein